MKRFEDNPAIEGCRDYKRIVKKYNRLVRTLVAFEILWFQAWCQAIEKGKAGLSATLIVRHPDDDNLYVNFDPDLFQLVRESKCLERMGTSMPIPEGARVLVSETAPHPLSSSGLFLGILALHRLVCRGSLVYFSLPRFKRIYEDTEKLWPSHRAPFEYTCFDPSTPLLK